MLAFARCKPSMAGQGRAKRGMAGYVLVRPGEAQHGLAMHGLAVYGWLRLVVERSGVKRCVPVWQGGTRYCQFCRRR